MADADRISELPEPILHQILSFLSQKEAIQTSALSKPWRHVGPTGPKIELRESCFQKSGRASFLSVLGKTLQRYNHQNLSVHEFILEMLSDSDSDSDSESDCHHCLIDPESISVLDKGIPMLLSNMGVKKFDFSVPNYVVDPSIVFGAEFLTELCLSECKFMRTTNDHDHDKPLFKGLKRLSLHKVHIKDDTLEKIVRSCPLIEYLLVSDCKGLKTIPLTIFQAEFLTELHLTGWKFPGESLFKRGHSLIFTAPSSTELHLIKRLKTLSLEKVNISDLKEIMNSCPLIERVLLTDCVGLKNIQLKNNTNNLKHFSGSFYRVNIQSIEIDAPTIETISIAYCPNWCGHDKYFFPRLKTLYLKRVKLSAEFFESFSSNFSSLEELELQSCYGFSDIQLTLCSVKRLVLNIDSTDHRLVITIYAPNIRYFGLSSHFPPQLNFYTETPRDQWKSHVVMLSNRCSDNEASMLPWLLQLSELLNSLSESQMSLNVFPNPFKNLKVEDIKNAGFGKPVPLEHVSVEGGVSGGNQYSSFPYFLKCLFLICRPRYIGMNWYITNSETVWKLEKNNLAEFLVFKIIRKNQGEWRGYSYLWERDLKEISMQVWNENSKGWNTVRIEGTSLPEFTSLDTQIRFPVKWRN